MQFIKTSISNTLHSTPVKVVIIVLAVLFIAYLALVINYRIKRARYKNAVREAKRAQAAKAQTPAHAGTRPAAEPQPRSPKIDYFPSEAPQEQPPAPRRENVTNISDATTVIPSVTPDRSAAQDASKIDRDYFEEFFRNK